MRPAPLPAPFLTRHTYAGSSSLRSSTAPHLVDLEKVVQRSLEQQADDVDLTRPQVVELDGGCAVNAPQARLNLVLPHLAQRLNQAAYL